MTNDFCNISVDVIQLQRCIHNVPIITDAFIIWIDLLPLWALVWLSVC